MDRSKKQIIQDLFEQYDIHPDCVDEIQRLVIDKKIGKAFFRILQKNTRFLQDLGYSATKAENFEKLQGSNDLYSMKFKGHNMNLRILYTYKQGKLALLLCCFYERSDSIETYAKYIPTAEKRMKEMED